MIRITLHSSPSRGKIILPRILVVDDDPMVSMAVEVCLKRRGFDVTVADGAEAGLAALETSKFDVMLIDVFMPQMRGYDSIRIFHQRAPSLPLLAMSGHAFADLGPASAGFPRMTLELGATSCLRKPFTPEALLAAITECLAIPPLLAGARN